MTFHNKTNSCVLDLGLHTPTSTVVNLNTAVKIVAGIRSVCAILSNQKAKCWGDNSTYAIGDGTTTNRLVPTNPTGLSTGVKSVGVGALHSCAIMTAGNIKCWGNNSSGGVGNNTTTNASTPTNISSAHSDFIEVSASSGLFQSHTCALRSNGQAMCWGQNGSMSTLYGAIGNGSTFIGNFLTPQNVINFP